VGRDRAALFVTNSSKDAAATAPAGSFERTISRLGDYNPSIAAGSGPPCPPEAFAQKRLRGLSSTPTGPARALAVPAEFELFQHSFRPPSGSVARCGRPVFNAPGPCACGGPMILWRPRPYAVRHKKRARAWSEIWPR